MGYRRQVQHAKNCEAMHIRKLIQSKGEGYYTCNCDWPSNRLGFCQHPAGYAPGAAEARALQNALSTLRLRGMSGHQDPEFMGALRQAAGRNS